MRKNGKQWNLGVEMQERRDLTVLVFHSVFRKKKVDGEKCKFIESLKAEMVNGGSECEEEIQREAKETVNVKVVSEKEVKRKRVLKSCKRKINAFFYSENYGM